ncbi:hypothetical protein Tco_0307265 [Tanacetum coccineum]
MSPGNYLLSKPDLCHSRCQRMLHGAYGKGTRKANLGGRKAGRLHTRQETRNLGLKKITDDKGPVPIRFEWDDKKTMMPLGGHASHWSIPWGLTREDAFVLPMLAEGPAERKRDRDQNWHPAASPKAIQYPTRLLSSAHWVINPETGTYDVETIRQGPSHPRAYPGRQWPEWDPCRARIRDNHDCGRGFPSADANRSADGLQKRPKPISVRLAISGPCQCGPGLSLGPYPTGITSTYFKSRSLVDIVLYTCRHLAALRIYYAKGYQVRFSFPACVHPSLPGPDKNILQSPGGKIGVYTRFFDFANYRIPLSQFLVEVLDHFHIHLSQLSVFGAAKVSYFEILCRVHGFQPSVNCFCAFYTSSYTKGWMSFSKHYDATPVFHSKPLDSVKNWNDHFFWVDSTTFPFSVSLKSKILSKDPPPKLFQYDTEACDFLRTHTAPFRKFLEPFLCWVGISRYYTLDENCYLTFWDGEEEMDLFAFIRHSDPTKVRVRERNLAEREVKLLKMTEGCTVSLGPPVTAAPGDSSDSIDRLFDEGNDAGQEHSFEKDDDVLEEAISKDASEKLRDDYQSLPPNTSRKSLAALRGIIPEGSDLPSGATEPLIVAFVAPMPDVGPVDSVSELNLRTLPPHVRYVVSSDGSHHSGSYSEATSFVRSLVADAPIVTVAVTTTVDADVVAGSKARDVSKDFENIGDSTSAGGVNVDAGSISKLKKTSTSSDSFYAS